MEGGDGGVYLRTVSKCFGRGVANWKFFMVESIGMKI